MVKPTFYCENCGREVSSGLETCPDCGQDFSSVRCPSCGFTGVPELFKKSCPSCGYVGEDVINKSKNNKKVNFRVRTKNYLPAWIYRVVIGALLVLIIYLLRVYFLL